MLVAQRYELGEVLGAGGEARVFRARDLRTETDVALRLSARLPPPPSTAEPPHHPGWVRLLEWGRDSEHGAYEIFELLQGKTLETLVSAQPLPAEAWLDFVRQSLNAVAALHQTGWAHGDLNAGNWVRETDGTWKLLELPFRHAGLRETRSAQFGSIYTLAPEQIDGQRPDARSDVYALGCLYYYAAGGAYPHAGSHIAEIAVSRLRFDPEPLLASTLPPHRADWVMQLLATKAADRPANAAAARALLSD